MSCPHGHQLNEIFGGGSQPVHWVKTFSRKARLNTRMHTLKKVFDDNPGTVILELEGPAL
jgi:hypothetical protein